MAKLSPKQFQTLAACICGGDADGFVYRRQVDIDAFMRFSGAGQRAEGYPGSRFSSTCLWLEDANDSELSPSGLPGDIELIITALLDRREFSSDHQHDAAIEAVGELLSGTGAKIDLAPDKGVTVVSARSNRGQQVLEAQIHTAFGAQLAHSSLQGARIHYDKARRFLNASHPDYGPVGLR